MSMTIDDIKAAITELSVQKDRNKDQILAIRTQFNYWD